MQGCTWSAQPRKTCQTLTQLEPGISLAHTKDMWGCRGSSNTAVLVAWAAQELGKAVGEAKLRLGELPDSPSTCAALESLLRRLVAPKPDGEGRGRPCAVCMSCRENDGWAGLRPASCSAACGPSSTAGGCRQHGPLARDTCSKAVMGQCWASELMEAWLLCLADACWHS